MNVQLLNSRVLVKRDPKETKTASGFVVPDKAQKSPDIGTVVAAGPGRVLDNGNRLEMPVKVNDRVMFQKNAGQLVDLDGVEHLVLEESEIIAIMG